jgi:hypothetical protein
LGAASVIAVIDITAKIASLCFQYTMAVKDAKNNVKHIKKKVGDVKRVLEGVKKLLDGLHKADSLLLTTCLCRSSNACGS